MTENKIDSCIFVLNSLGFVVLFFHVFVVLLEVSKNLHFYIQVIDSAPCKVLDNYVQSGAHHLVINQICRPYGNCSAFFNVLSLLETNSILRLYRLQRFFANTIPLQVKGTRT
jgi:hypothetical protein